MWKWSVREAGSGILASRYFCQSNTFSNANRLVANKKWPQMKSMRRSVIATVNDATRSGMCRQFHHVFFFSLHFDSSICITINNLASIDSTYSLSTPHYRVPSLFVFHLQWNTNADDLRECNKYVCKSDMSERTKGTRLRSSVKMVLHKFNKYH